MDMPFLYAAIAIMLIVIIKDYLKKRYNFDMDNVNIDLSKLKTKLKPVNKSVTIHKKTGNKKLILVDAGTNKATVMATLRQITGLDYKSAKTAVEMTPSELLTNISDKEADLTKKALEFVGATLEIKE